MFFPHGSIPCDHLNMDDPRHSDAKYEVLPIESGYQWVLTCSLETTFSPEKPLGTRFLRTALESMRGERRDENTSPFYYALDHKYTSAILSLMILKPRDRLCVEELLSAGRDLGFHIFLATLAVGDASEDGYYHDMYYSYYDYNRHAYATAVRISSALRAESIYDLSGNEVLSSITLDKYDLLQRNCFDVCPDETEYSNYTNRDVTWPNQSLI
jgi:hypothetical protein